MARVLVDYIPPVDEEEQDIRFGVNKSINKLNEVIRLMATGINTVEYGDGTTSENMLVDYVAVTFASAGTELSAENTLRKIPTAIVGSRLTSGNDIYWSKAATTTTIYLKSGTNNLSGVVIIA